MQQWLTRFKVKLAVTHIALTLLTGEDILALVASLETGPAAVAPTIGGSGEAPLPSPKFKDFAQALLTETSGRFPLPRVIPTGIREAILDRLSRLTPAAALLTAAAVLGQVASFRQLAELAGMEDMAGLDGLEELVAKRLLLDTNQNNQSYLIAHDKIRDVVYAETSAARK